MLRRGGAKRPRFSVGGHSVFEQDDSSNHSGLGVMDYDDDSLSQQHTTMNSSDQHIPQQYYSGSQFVPDRPRRATQRPTSKPIVEDNTNLTACLDHLLRILSRKDKEGFFQFPVTDQIAPGYSQIITRPMDFSTLKKKINQEEYSTILDFRADFELMCDNAMKYNRPETIYWQAAKKLLTTGTKLISKEKLLSFRRSLECFARLTERELGFRIELGSGAHAPPSSGTDDQMANANDQTDPSNVENENLSSISIGQACSHRKPKIILKLPRYYEKMPTLLVDEDEEDELLPEEVLAQAQQAAQCAREKLSLRRPMCAYTLSCQRANGTTSLRLINQDDLSQPPLEIPTSQQQLPSRTITIGELSNMSSSAGGPSPSAYNPHSTPIVNESEKRNHLSPRYFLDYGPFSSHAPQYDSSFSSIAKDELDLLVHTYGSEFSAQYAVSLIDYVKDAGDLALAYVDRFLSVLTNGEHDNLVLKRREKQQISGENSAAKVETVPSIVTDEHNASIVSSDTVKTEPHSDHVRTIDTKLDENSKLLVQLRQSQYDRLSQPSNKLHQLLPLTQQPPSESMNEFELAEKVLHNLSDMTQISGTGPEQVISPAVVRHNLGVVIKTEPNNDSIGNNLEL